MKKKVVGMTFNSLSVPSPPYLFFFHMCLAQTKLPLFDNSRCKLYSDCDE
jgi:hypothetical protein